jgi:protein gp37
MNVTEINWTELTWNPASGCTKISPGCKYCYAETIAEGKRGTLAFPVGFDVVEKPKKLGEPAKVKRPSLIFTNSMSDFFHEQISDAYRERMLEAMEAAPQHRYQVLTKRPEIAARFFRARKAPACMWLGVTIESQSYAHRLEELRGIEAPVRFVSAEPLLGPLELELAGIDWLISGGESGLHLLRDERALALRALVRRATREEEPLHWLPREDRIDWVRSLRDQCQAAGTAFWHKQWGGPRPASAGRKLDGRTWDEMPVHVARAMPEAYQARTTQSRTLPLL